MNQYKRKKEKILKGIEKIATDMRKLGQKEFTLIQEWNDLKEMCPHENTRTFSTKSEIFYEEYHHISCDDCGLLLHTDTTSDTKSESIWNLLRKKFWNRKDGKL